MQNSLHFEYFKNFLRLHNAEAPLLFCLAVEDIKNELDARIQHMQINKCVQTYFLNAIPPGMQQASLSFYLTRLEIGPGVIHCWSLVSPCWQPQNLLPVLCSCLTSLDGPSAWCPVNLWDRGEKRQSCLSQQKVPGLLLILALCNASKSALLKPIWEELSLRDLKNIGKKCFGSCTRSPLSVPSNSSGFFTRLKKK